MTVRLPGVAVYDGVSSWNSKRSLDDTTVVDSTPVVDGVVVHWNSTSARKAAPTLVKAWRCPRSFGGGSSQVVQAMLCKLACTRQLGLPPLEARRRHAAQLWPARDAVAQNVVRAFGSH